MPPGTLSHVTKPRKAVNVMIVTNLAVNHIANPLGFDLGSRPTFSWIVEDAAGTKAVASRVVVTCDDMVVTDTGWADLDAKACALAMDLMPRTRYEWTVSVRTDAGEEAVSEPAWFETAKLGEPWSAAWVTCDYDEPRHPVFSREVSVDPDAIVSARLYACGLGVYQAFIDGEKVGCEHLAPGTHAYDSWLQYQTYDVTEQLRRSNGTPELSFMLGHGWYSGRFSFILTNDGWYGND